MADLDLTLAVNGTYQLTPKYHDQSGNAITPGGTITYSSSAPNIATVSSTGLITAVSVGIARVTAVNSADGAWGYAKVVVTDTPSAVSMDLT